MKSTATVAISAALASLPAAASIEEPAFEIVKSSGDYEIRRYAPRIVAQAEVEGDLWGASNAGFRVIAGYIFGNNVSSEKGESAKIPMTAPVTAEPVSERIAMTSPVTVENAGARYRIHFVMPAQYTMATLPRPTDDRVKLRELPAQRMAVLRFTGLSGEGKVKEKTADLLGWMKAEDLEAAGAPQLARYDPPWTLPFLRRNEIMVPLR